MHPLEHVWAHLQPPWTPEKLKELRVIGRMCGVVAFDFGERPSAFLTEFQMHSGLLMNGGKIVGLDWIVSVPILRVSHHCLWKADSSQTTPEPHPDA